MGAIVLVVPEVRPKTEPNLMGLAEYISIIDDAVDEKPSLSAVSARDNFVANWTGKGISSIRLISNRDIWSGVVDFVIKPAGEVFRFRFKKLIRSCTLIAGV
jgi:hypothetical protein